MSKSKIPEMEIAHQIMIEYWDAKLSRLINSYEGNDEEIVKAHIRAKIALYFGLDIPKTIYEECEARTIKGYNVSANV